MTRGTEVVEGFWVGNDCDVPGGADDGAGSRIQFDLCVKVSSIVWLGEDMLMGSRHLNVVKCPAR
jgi:hypothetical protein